MNYGFQPHPLCLFSLRNLGALGVSALSFSFSSPVDCAPSAVNCPSLTPFPATLTRSSQIAENTATLSPAFATLTDCVKHKSFVCHSYKKHPGWGYPPPPAPRKNLYNPPAPPTQRGNF